MIQTKNILTLLILFITFYPILDKLLFYLKLSNDTLIWLYIYSNILLSSFHNNHKIYIMNTLNYTLSSFLVNIACHKILYPLYKTRIGLIIILAIFGYLYKHYKWYRTLSIYITSCEIIILTHRILSLSIYKN